MKQWRIGFAAVSASLLCAPGGVAQGMEFRIAGDQIIMSGIVSNHDDDQLQHLLDEHPGTIRMIVLRNSPGGYVYGSYNIAAMIRGRGLDTAVSGGCMSACAIMFMGGVERHFTDEQPAGKTFVAFHGAHYKRGGAAYADSEQLRYLIIKYSDGKADPALVDRMVANTDGLMFFFDSERVRRPDGISIFDCKGTEKSVTECEKIANKTGYDLGIFTSKTLVKVNP